MDLNDKFLQNYQNADTFLKIFERLIDRENFELESTEISFLFEIIASNLLFESSVYFDGAIGLHSRIRKPRQIEFIGKMWVGSHKSQWLESFTALVTDKRITKQGILIKIQIGENQAVGDLSDAFNLPLYAQSDELLLSSKPNV